MTLGQFKKYIQSLPNGRSFLFSISRPFSWRGVYSDVAFSLSNEPSAKEDVLAKIEVALTEVFEGYKGGDYRYNEFTEIHFERGHSGYTDGEYAKEFIEANGGEGYSLEEKAVRIAFN